MTKLRRIIAGFFIIYTFSILHQYFISVVDGNNLYEHISSVHLKSQIFNIASTIWEIGDSNTK